MTDSYIQLPADSTGKKVDTEQLTVAAQTVERERVQIAGDVDTQIAPVSATAGLKVDLGTDNDVEVGFDAGEGAALPSTFAVIAGDDGTDTHPIQVDASGRVKVTLDAQALPTGGNNIGDVDVLTMPGTAAEAAALPAVLVVVAGDDGVDTHALQMNAAGDVKVTLDSETVDISDRAGRDLGGVDIVAELPAGTQNIGDVDVASMSALVTGTAKVGIAGKDVVNPHQGATALTVSFTEIDAAASGDNVIVAAQGAGNKIRVLAVALVCSGGANTCEWRSATTPISGGMGFANLGGYSAVSEFGLFETAANVALNLNLSAATSVDGHITYVVTT
jgi:hypothetical protein